MREIKFMAFLRSDQRLPNGITLGYEKYPRGIYEVMDLNFASEIVTLWSEREQTSFEVSFRKVEIMQYTGFRDKNGREIYTDHLVEWGLRTYRVCFDCGFYLHDLSGINPDYPITKEFKNASDEFEIVGSVWQNPELLK
ncbi:YopX family protein [Campylobacter concisus]|uniref:YopX family protein n=1 Tax=Campylobacter concisus TaxID=199 RepID=UPI000556EBE9|nr:YopX family protein [Campylobacter concisus]